jgi:hypothetical protein
MKERMIANGPNRGYPVAFVKFGIIRINHFCCDEVDPKRKKGSRGQVVKGSSEDLKNRALNP